MIKQKEEKLLNLLIILPIVFFIISIFVLPTIYYYHEYDELEESIEKFKINHLKSQKELIKNETQKAIQIVKSAKFAIKKYKLDKKTVQKMLLDDISKIRFGKNGYFFIYDYNGVNLMHPIKPQLVGKNLYNLKDKNGVLLIQKLIDSAKSGGKYVSYVWDNPTTKKSENKIGYALGVDDWGWMIGTGIYTEDMQKEIRLKTKKKEEEMRELVYSVLSIMLIPLIIMTLLLYILLKKVKNNILNYNYNLEIQTKKAQTSSKAKSEFLANMSHEIRTPLNAIMGFIDLLTEKENDKEKLEYLNTINSSSQSLVGIINDILDFSKLESGKLSIEYIDFNPTKEFGVTKNLFKAKCEEKNITLHVNFTNLPNSLNGDVLRIKQTINNLLSNAVKFTPKGKNIYLNIGYENNLLSVSVKDEGIGINKKNQDKIFKAFTQEDSSTTRKFGGTGLGLTISYNIVKIMNGELKVKSELGIGSEFYFFIPLKIGKEIKTLKQNDTSITLKGNILVAEDNKANQMFMKVLLKKLKLTFDIADDGVEAVKLYKQNHDRYDAILMDENMPNMDGIEATKQILNYEKENNLTHTPIIALTANALKGDRERFLSVGMDEYLTKPANKKKLSEILGKFLR